MLQLFELAHLPCPALSDFHPPDAGARGMRPRDTTGFVDIPGGTVTIGADPADGFAYDNERPCHRVEVKPFRLAREPASNAQWLDFINQGGYCRRELWSAEGWA